MCYVLCLLDLHSEMVKLQASRSDARNGTIRGGFIYVVHVIWWASQGFVCVRVEYLGVSAASPHGRFALCLLHTFN